MRESRTFARRTQVFSEDKTLRKYFLVYEGADTEDIYFSAVNAMRGEIGIDPLIELIPIIRSYSEESWSNPKKILDRVIRDLEESKTGHISYETLLNRIMDHFYESGAIVDKLQEKNIWDTMCRICREDLCQAMDRDVEDVSGVCNKIFERLRERCGLRHVVSDISDIIERENITYAEGFDKICFIVDRDRESFLSTPGNDQYSYVVDKCREKGFGLYVTNPCFEFWLLLHFDSVREVDREKMAENPKVTAKRRYAEQELRKIWPEYKKNSYEAKVLVADIDKAIANEKQFCEDVAGLEKNVGSNIGLMICEMRGS